DDIGTSGVIGSALFNILLVISICGFAVRESVFLHPFPLLRDSIFYLLSVAALFAILYDDRVFWQVLLLCSMRVGVILPTGKYLNQEEDDIGTSGVIGSALFNILLVISICGFAVRESVFLHPFPLLRDSIFYLLSVAALFAILYDDRVFWQVLLLYEALCLLLLYILYIVFMYHNHAIHAIFLRCKPEEEEALVKKEPSENEVFHRFTFGIPDTVLGLTLLAVGVSLPDAFSSLAVVKEGFGDMAVSNAIGSNTFDILLCLGLPWFIQTTMMQYGSSIRVSGDGFTFGIPDTVLGLTLLAVGVSLPDAFSSLAVVKEGFGDMAVSNAIGSNTFDILLCLGLPWFIQTTMMQYGSSIRVSGDVFDIGCMGIVAMKIGSCGTEFARGVVQGVLDAAIGFTFGIPDTVLGLTLLAVGVSLPDAFSSLAVVKEGFGDMAVSNAIGSNTFDILLCLGLPWFIQTTMMQYGSSIRVSGDGLGYTSLLLFLTVIFTVLAILINKWRLDKKLAKRNEYTI
ncbi:unnamed protein product, partial [Darwinula stevensoni]